MSADNCGDEIGICPDGALCEEDICQAIVYLPVDSACVTDNPLEVCGIGLECVDSLCIDPTAQSCGNVIALSGSGGTETGTTLAGGGLNAKVLGDCTGFASLGAEQVFSVELQANAKLSVSWTGMNLDDGTIDGFDLLA